MTLQEADDLLRGELTRLHVDLDNPKLALLPVLNALQIYYRVEGNQFMTNAAHRLLTQLEEATTAAIESRRLAT